MRPKCSGAVTGLTRRDSTAAGGQFSSGGQRALPGSNLQPDLEFIQMDMRLFIADYLSGSNYQVSHGGARWVRAVLEHAFRLLPLVKLCLCPDRYSLHWLVV